MTFGARARVNLGALRHNLDVLRQRARGAKLMAVVKANAYGHNMLAVAKALGDVDCLAVSRLSEARALRQAGTGRPVALLSGVGAAADLDEAASLGLQLVVHHAQQIDWLENHRGGTFTVWLKIDTGMRRLGIAPGDVAQAITRLGRCRAVAETRVMTHFASADEPDNSATAEQVDLFLAMIRGFEGDVSVAGSAAIFGWPDAHKRLMQTRDAAQTWLRPGLALYGMSPFPGQCGADLGLRPVMQFESTLIAVKALGKGDRVGYGGTWQAPADSTLGIVAAGYGDGYSRFIPSGTPVLVNGRRVEVIGRVSMDLTAVDLGPGSGDRIGDPVILWGDGLPVEEIATCAGTIPYQLVAGITHREAAVFDQA